MKLNPILKKKIFGVLPVPEALGIICAVTCANLFEAHVRIENECWRWLAWLGMWIVGIVLCALVIALVKKYITKEE